MVEATLPSTLPVTDAAVFRHRLLRRLRSAVLLMTVLCAVIGVFLGVIFGKPLSVPHFVYSYTIGFSCWGLGDGLKLAVKAWRLWRHPTEALRTDTLVSWRTSAPLVMLGTFAGLPLGLELGDWLTGYRSPSLLQWDLPSTRVTLAVTIVAATFTFFAMTTLEHLAAARIRAEAARAEATALQLKLLQSQLEPHMLFNTLATLRVLIGLDAAQAQAMLDRLIGFLRSTLAASRSERHPLATEFARVDDYLALMALRMGPRLQTHLELPEALRELTVPPLILQPLVENAIRHGLEPKVGAGLLRVAASRHGTRLRLEVFDDGVGFAPRPAAGGSGFGLEQVRQRLATLHGKAASLVVEAADAGGTRACIELPVEEPHR